MDSRAIAIPNPRVEYRKTSRAIRLIVSQRTDSLQCQYPCKSYLAILLIVKHVSSCPRTVRDTFLTSVSLWASSQLASINITFFTEGEGTQRLCFEHKVRLGKIDAIFLTRNDSSVMGGLPGLCLTAADAGKSSMTVVGPKGIEAYWKMISIFAYRPSFSVVMDEISPDQLSDRVFDKGDISILPIILTPSNTMAYICKTPQLFGKFDIVKAAALNVPKGPLFGRLKLGHSVTLSDGSVVQPEQVLGQPELSRYVMIIGSMDDIDSSTSEQFEALLACALDRKEFSMFQDSQRSSRMDCM